MAQTTSARLDSAVAWAGTLGIGVLGAVISVARLLVTNWSALETVLFAEDGIFPLCVAKADGLSCLLDPYAGYLIFTPRILAVPISWLPLESWALAANVVAALSVGVLTAVSFASLVRWGLSAPWSALVALAPVAAPIVGFEAINVYASVYMPLLFTMTIVLVTWTHDRRPWWPTVGLVVTALTIPSAVVLVIPLLVLAVRRVMRPREAGILAAGLGLGLAIQAFIALSATNQRPIAVSMDSLRGWVDNIPVALTTVWPGLAFGSTTVFGIFTNPVQAATGWLLVVGLLVLGIWLTSRRSDVGPVVGSMILVGLAVGAIPTIIGYASNRYYVIPVLLWIAALIVALGVRGWRRPTVAWILVTAVMIFAWWPAFGASPWRATGTPSWEDEVARITAECSTDPGAVVDVLFTPDWPMPQVEVFEPTTNRVPCLSLGLWR